MESSDPETGDGLWIVAALPGVGPADMAVAPRAAEMTCGCLVVRLHHDSG